MGRHRRIHIAIHIPKGEATSMANQVSGCSRHSEIPIVLTNLTDTNP